jgi:hypothetical protein
MRACFKHVRSNLHSSPFSHTKTRVKYYHSFCVTTGLTMAAFLANEKWGPSTVLLRHVCWNELFGVRSTHESEVRHCLARARRARAPLALDGAT